MSRAGRGSIWERAASTVGSCCSTPRCRPGLFDSTCPPLNSFGPRRESGISWPDRRPVRRRSGRKAEHPSQPRSKSCRPTPTDHQKRFASNRFRRRRRSSLWTGCMPKHDSSAAAAYWLGLNDPDRRTKSHRSPKLPWCPASHRARACQCRWVSHPCLPSRNTYWMMTWHRLSVRAVPSHRLRRGTRTCAAMEC